MVTLQRSSRTSAQNEYITRRDTLFSSRTHFAEQRSVQVLSVKSHLSSTEEHEYEEIGDSSLERYNKSQHYQPSVHRHSHHQYGKNHGRRHGKVKVLLASISVSVGLGNVWRFPTLVLENGGAPFIVAYLIAVIIVGIPLYCLELALGQFSSSGYGKVWKVLPVLKGVRYGQFLVNLYLAVYTTYVMGVCLYLSVPWTSSKEPLLEKNSTSCKYLLDAEQENYYGVADFWKYRQLGGTSHLEMCGISWQLAVCFLIALVVVYGCLACPVVVFNKVRYVIFTLSYFGLVLLLILALVDRYGAVKAAVFPTNWNAFINITMVYKACQQVIFSLGIGFGHVLVLSSNNKFKNNVFIDAVGVSIIDTLTSLLCTCVVFSVIPSDKFLNGTVKVNSDDINFLYMLHEYSDDMNMWPIMFYVTVAFLGLGTLVVYLQSTIRIVCLEERRGKSWWLVSLAVILLCLVMDLTLATNNGRQLFRAVDNFGLGVTLYVICIFEIVGIMYCYGWKHFFSDLTFMIGSKPGVFWKISWLILSPVALIAIFIYEIVAGVSTRSTTFKQLTIGWALAGLAVMQIPLWAVIMFCKAPAWGYLNRLHYIFTPEADWGPTHPVHRRNWLNEKDRKRLRAPHHLAHINYAFRDDTLEIRRVLQSSRPTESTFSQPNAPEKQSTVTLKSEEFESIETHL